MGTEKPIGYSAVHRVGVAPNAAGERTLCYQGGEKQINLLRGVPGLEYWCEFNCLALPINRTNLLLLETIAAAEESTDDYATLRYRQFKPPAGYIGRYPQPVEGDNLPFTHQVEAFAHAVKAFESGRPGFGQWSEMGTGKTKWLIDLLRYYQPRVSLIIVQNSTSLQWKANLERTWPGASAHMLTDSSLEKRKEEIITAVKSADFPLVFVVNWEALSRLAPALKCLKIDFLVADEASRLRNRRTKMAKAAFQLADIAKYKVAMSGTPIGNAPTDLWGLYRFIDPDIFGKSYWNFVKRYFRLGGFSGQDFVGFEPDFLPEFIEKCYRQAYRTTKAVVCDMPPKQYEVVKVEMGKEQAALYKQMEESLYVEQVSETGERRVLTAATALDQAVRLQQITAGVFCKSGKTEWVAEYVRDVLEDETARLIVWTRFKLEQNAVLAELSKVGVTRPVVAAISGETPKLWRENYRVQFNDHLDPLQVLVIQIQCGALGLDLPACTEMIYHSSTFSLIERAQSEDRGHRMGRTLPYKITDVICDDTIDQKILSAVRRKQSLADLLLVDSLTGSR